MDRLAVLAKQLTAQPDGTLSSNILDFIRYLIAEPLPLRSERKIRSETSFVRVCLEGRYATVWVSGNRSHKS